jgi:hypothetical protein
MNTRRGNLDLLLQNDPVDRRAQFSCVYLLGRAEFQALRFGIGNIGAYGTVRRLLMTGHI